MPNYSLDQGSLPLLWGEKIRLGSNFVFNDRSVLERARITGIDGLMDSDLRDTRQDIPDFDGEDFYDLLRGGRTISIDGELRAGNLHSLANLRQRFKAAVQGQNDLWFNRYDWSDDFSTAVANTGWTVYNDVAKLTQNTGSGYIEAANAADVFLARPNMKPTGSSRMVSAIKSRYGVGSGQWLAHVHTLIKPGTVTYANSLVTPRGAGLTADLIAAVMNISDGKMQIWRIQGGQALVLAEQTWVSMPSSLPGYFVSEQRGNTINFSYYTGADPRTSDATHFSSGVGNISLSLSGADATKYGNGVYAPTGLWMGALDTSDGMQISNHSVEGIGPTDALILGCRRASPIAGRESQEDSEYKRGFQFALRSADPLIYSNAVEFVTLLPTTVETLGRPYDWNYDVAYDTPIDNTGAAVSAGTVTVNNIGDANTYPEVIFQNGQSNPALQNKTTGETLIINGSQSDSGLMIVNLRTGIITDQNGDDISNLVDPNSQRLRLAPGSNVLSYSVEANNGSAQTLVRFRNAWG